MVKGPSFIRLTFISAPKFPVSTTGTDSLHLKESDRLRAVREHRTDHDHRMAMALLIAGYEVDDTDCIRKSYPQFLEQYHRICQPILGKT